MTATMSFVVDKNVEKIPALDLADYAILVALCQLGMQGTVLKDFLRTEAGFPGVTKSTFYRRLSLLKEAGLVQQENEEGIPFYICTEKGKKLVYFLSLRMKDLSYTAVEALFPEVDGKSP